ncbi:MAG TPA: glycosyl transferase [Roseiflexaceae bacterium]|nr:glycosyl transferase [Roseiflexaceae bacterium]
MRHSIMRVWRSTTVRVASGRAGAVATWRPALAALALGLLALLPRTLGLADYFTTDEAYHWITRTERFSAALAAGRWGDTLLTGHPGVTNMWLGSLGLALERSLLGAGLIESPSPVEHLAWLRLPGATLQAMLVPAGYLLLRRLVAPFTALVAGALWATSPYLIAHGRLLHLDALLTSFVTLSLLLLIPTNDRRPKTEDEAPDCEGRGESALIGSRSSVLGPWSLVGSAVCGGLALLTKGPALVLLPFAGLLTIVACSVQHAAWRRPRSVIYHLQSAFPRFALWLGVALLTVVALWPALWAEPGRALARYAGEIVSNGGRPNGDGQFFLGRAVADPGPLFYPLADLFRTTPLALVGLLAYVGFGIWDVGSWIRAGQARLKSNIHNPTLLVLLAFVLFWTLVMTLGPKKFDRYVLPTWPALLVLSAAGLTRIADRLAARDTARASGRIEGYDRQRRVGRRSSVVGRWSLAGLVLAAELSQPLLVHPYYLSYYNPLLGGGTVAQRTFLIGWGEGMDQVGAWLRARPDIGYGPVLSALGRTLQPFVPVDVRDVEDYGRLPANYAVVYLESVQRGAHPEIYRALQGTVPLHRVVIHGIEYARIYQLPRPFATPLDARFGTGLTLRGVTVERAPGRITVTPAWDVRTPPAGDYHAFVHLLDAQGRRVAQVDAPPGGGDAPPTGRWQAGQQIAVPLPLELPPALPPGAYRLTLGLYDTASGARLPLTAGTPADPAVAGEHALLLGTVEIP